MTFTLHVDGPTWRTHLTEVATAVPGLVPVAKGNGYGFGNARLAAEAGTLGVPVLAVGTARELADVRTTYGGDLLVLTPWHPATDSAGAPTPTRG